MTPGRVNDPDSSSGYVEVELPTSRGDVAGRYYGPERPDAGVVFVGGAGGGWDTPAGGFYSNGAQAAAELPPGCALLLAHGSDDEVLTPYNSRFAHRLAHKPKRLVLYRGAGHGLDEVAGEVHLLVSDWLRRWLAATR
jgi:pimeloyl-ACP methyl ester carboxylesterase